MAAVAVPDVSIIICTYSRAALLKRTLLSLERLFDIDKAEVIVVDNHSIDNTAEVVQECIGKLQGKVRLRYVFEARQGLSIARNTGIEQSTAPILAFLDDDAVPTMNWLNSMKKAFEKSPNVGAVGGIIHPDFEGDRPEWLIKSLEFPYAIVNLGDKERPYPRKLYPFGANMAIRRGAITASRLSFPEDLGRKGTSLLSGEETWFFGKLRKSGWQLLYVPGMAVKHYISAERLREEWIRKRYFFQGVSMAKEGKGAFGRLRIVANIAARRLYIAFHSLSARTPGERMLKECRLESIKGAMQTLRSKGAEATYD